MRNMNLDDFIAEHAGVIKKILIALIIAILFAPLIFKTKPLLPDAEAVYERVKEKEVSQRIALEEENLKYKTAVYQLCVSEKDIAKAKIHDNAIGEYQLTNSETLALLEEQANKPCEPPRTKEEGSPQTIKPDELFYVFKKSDGPYISQTLKQHFAANGYLATDVATGGKKLQMYAPSFEFLDGSVKKDESRQYTVKVVKNYNTMGETIELHWTEGEDKMNWAIGHVHSSFLSDGDNVTTGDVIGTSGGCPGELKLNEKSTGCHVHIELRKNGDPIPYPQYMYSNHGEDLNNYKKFKNVEKATKSNLKTSVYTTHTDDKNLAAFLASIHLHESGRCEENCRTSPVGARGPMQFMDKTFKTYHCENLNNVQHLEDSVCAATKYVKQILSDKTKDRPNLELKWRLWQVACHYNSGYKYVCERKKLEEAKAYGIIRYADGVIQEYERILPKF